MSQLAYSLSSCLSLLNAGSLCMCHNACPEFPGVFIFFFKIFKVKAISDLQQNIDRLARLLLSHLKMVCVVIDTTSLCFDTYFLSRDSPSNCICTSGS